MVGRRYGRSLLRRVGAWRPSAIEWRKNRGGGRKHFLLSDLVVVSAIHPRPLSPPYRRVSPLLPPVPGRGKAYFAGARPPLRHVATDPVGEDAGQADLCPRLIALAPPHNRSVARRLGAPVSDVL